MGFGLGLLAALLLLLCAALTALLLRRRARCGVMGAVGLWGGGLWGWYGVYGVGMGL